MKNRVQGFSRDGIQVRWGLVGAQRYLKASWPVRYGLFHEIRTPSYLFQFSAEGVIRFVQGRPGTWHEHTDWFKRTAGGDWVYYSSGGYNGAFSAIGEHYIPIFPYHSNPVIGEKAYPAETLRAVLQALETLTAWAEKVAEELPPEGAAFLSCVARKNQKDTLASQADRFHELTHGPLTVLPPDCRHVDYDILPLRLARGCLYHCRFCEVKSSQTFAVEAPDHVTEQVASFSDHFKADLIHMGGVFLGEHDALAAGEGPVVAAAEACETLFSGDGRMADRPSLFLFGSPHALLNVSEAGWEALDHLPFNVAINTGVESLDPPTLDYLGRPTPVALVKEAVKRADEVMRRCRNVSVSLNMVTGDALPPSHHESLSCFVASRDTRDAPLYLSPLKDHAHRRTTMAEFTALKRISRAPLFLYLLQRL
ncbi:radical SAM protein [Desulfoluna sp.]|uniref:radical SAM protein n=1 Tax=Desulfoluna sp. TaxID=2045199 RepID=UPI002621C08B|nr:radical SAM protein [Desulfoluna sp.]